MTEDNNDTPVEVEETQEQQATEEQVAENKPRGNGLASVIAVIALLLAVGAAGGVYWLWQQAQQQQVSVQTQFRSAQSSLDNVISQLDARIAELLAEQSKAAEEQRNLKQSLSSLHEELGRDRNAWAVAETMYFLQLANARLQLLQDIDTALEALSIADTRLQALGDPGFIPVREKIKTEIASLKAVAKTDLTGTALSLGALASQIPALPLHAPAKHMQQEVSSVTVVSEEEQPLWKQELNKAWVVMRQLVDVRRTDKRIEPLLKPEEQQLLVQNIQLQLQTARIAVIQRDNKLYKDSLTTAADWINNAYDLDADITKSTLEQINTLAALELSPQLPDISASLRLLRNMSDNRVEAAIEADEK
jgi:uroporphyrin-3 C-methyltransferase